MVAAAQDPADPFPTIERRLLLGNRHHRIRPARHLRDHRRTVELLRSHSTRATTSTSIKAPTGREGRRRILRHPARGGSATESNGRSGNLAILHKMGTVWEDEGRVKVDRRPAGRFDRAGRARLRLTSSAAISFCRSLSAPCRRSSPRPISTASLPRTAKPMAMVITGKKFQQQVGTQRCDLRKSRQRSGSEGRRLFPHLPLPGHQHETAYQTPRYAFDHEDGMAIGRGHLRLRTVLQEIQLEQCAARGHRRRNRAADRTEFRDCADNLQPARNLSGRLRRNRITGVCPASGPGDFSESNVRLR